MEKLSVFFVLCTFTIYCNGLGKTEVVLPIPDGAAPCSTVANVTSQCPDKTKFGDDCTCAVPWPFPWIETGTCANGVWTVNEDILCPPNTLVDICNGVVQVNGNFVLPPSSNISLYRSHPEGEPTTVAAINFDEGQLRISGQLLQYGKMLLKLENRNPVVIEAPDGTTTTDDASAGGGRRRAVATEAPVAKVIQASDPPADGATFLSLTTHGSAQLSGDYEVWQTYNGQTYDFVVCQTLQTRYSEDQQGTSQILELGVFDQCTHDLHIFVLVMGIVGGAIILFSVGYLIYVVVSSIKSSMEEPAERDYEIKDYDL